MITLFIPSTWNIFLVLLTGVSLQVTDIVDRLFVSMFDHLNEKCSKELEAVRQQHPFENLKVSLQFQFFFSLFWVRHDSVLLKVELICCLIIQYLRKTLQLTYEEGIKMLQVRTHNGLSIFVILILCKLQRLLKVFIFCQAFKN